jgi:hypothetical protein
VLPAKGAGLGACRMALKFCSEFGSHVQDNFVMLCVLMYGHAGYVQHAFRSRQRMKNMASKMQKGVVRL